MSLETAILLPTATVHLFLKDQETINSAKNLQNDWRFARVNVEIKDGSNVDDAIQLYQESTSPNLMIIETDITDESFVGRLEALAGACSEGTNAVVIGPINDIELYRSLTSMGVSDYLVKPVALNVLSEIIAGLLVKELGTVGSRLIGLVGAKGGVGTSSITQALAFGISEDLDQKTFLMDVAGGWSSLSVGIGYEAMTTLHETARAAAEEDEDMLSRMLFKPNERLSILASGAEPMLEASIHSTQLEELLDFAMKSFPVVIVDLSSAIPSVKRTVIDRAHQLIIVSTPTLPSLRSTRTLMKEIKSIKGGSEENIDLIINMQGLMGAKEVSNKDVEMVLECKPTITIPFDAKLSVAFEDSMKPLQKYSSGKDLIDKLMPIARKILSIEDKHIVQKENTDFLSSIMGKIKKK